MTIRAGRPLYSVPQSRPRSLSATSAMLLPVHADSAVDINTTVDTLIQFSASAITPSTMDTTLAAYYPATSGWGVEAIGIPAGSKYMAALGVQANGKLGIKPTASPSYSGTKQMHVYADRTVASVYEVEFGTPIAVGDSFSMIVLCKRASALTGNAAIVFNLSPAQGAGTDTHPRASLGSTAGNLATASVTNDAGTGSATPATQAWNTQEDALLGLVYDATADTVTVMLYTDSLGFGTTTSGTTIAIDAAMSWLHIGGNNAGATLWQGNIGPILVMRYAITQTEFLACYGPNSPPWPLNMATPASMVEWIPCLSSAPGRCWSTGRTLSLHAAGTAGNHTYATQTGPATLTPNRWLTQNSTNVKQILYTEAESADLALTGSSLGMHRAQTAIALDSASENAPDPDDADFVSIAVGSTLVGCGPGEKISVENTSGSAGDTGTLNIVGLTYAQTFRNAEYARLTGSDVQVDFEVLHAAPLSGTTTVDPNNSALLKVCHFESTTAKTWVWNANPITGSFATLALNGEQYDTAQTWTGIGTSLKAPHFGLKSGAPKWAIYGCQTDSLGGSAKAHIYRCTPTLDGSGNPTAWTNLKIDASDDTGRINPLASQNPSDATVRVIFSYDNGVTTGLAYLSEADGIDHLIANTSPLTANSGFRWIPNSNLIVSTNLTTGAIQVTDTDTHVTTQITDTGLTEFDPQGWYQDGVLRYLSINVLRTNMRLWTADSTAALGYSIARSFSISSDAGSPVANWFWQSPEPTRIGDNWYMATTLKDTTLKTDAVSSANQTQIRLVNMDGTSDIRIDRGASDGGTVVRHEAEFGVSAADASGRLQLLVWINEAIGSVWGIWITRTGIFT